MIDIEEIIQFLKEVWGQVPAGSQSIKKHGPAP